jgi:hypothetical protein
MQYIASYKRDTQGNPTGLIVAFKDETGKIRFGWSSCNSSDTFNKKLAKDIALARAKKGVQKPIPSSLSSLVCSPTDNFMDRCKRYFKQEVQAPPFFTMDGKDKVLVEEL